MDIKTILICLSVINFFLGFYTFIIRQSQPTFPGITYWVISNFSISVGYFLISQRAWMPGFLTIVLAQVLFIFAGYLRIQGLFQFFKEKTGKVLNYIAVICFLIYTYLIIHFTYFYESMYMRTVILGLFSSFLSAYTGILLLKNKPFHGSKPYVFIALSFFAFSLIFLLRLAGWFFNPDYRNLFYSNFFNNLQFISNMVIDISWMTMFIIINNQRLTNQLTESNEKLDHLNQEKDRFLSIFSHDLKSSFGTLISLSQLLLLNFNAFTKNEIVHQLKLLSQTSQKTYFMFEDLLLWSTSGMNKIPFEPQKVTFKEIFDDVFDSVSYNANLKKTSISIEAKENELWADKNMCKVILRNLINNAIKFTGTEGEVIIRTEKENSFVLISVIDNGIGISHENQKKLWNNSKPYTNPGTSMEKGTGFGLLLCKDLVEKHGGKIWVESEENKGAAFRFTLPLPSGS